MLRDSAVPALKLQRDFEDMVKTLSSNPDSPRRISLSDEDRAAYHEMQLMPKIMQIPGFGEALTSELVDWRNKHERNFRFNPNEPVDRHEIDAMDRGLESERQNLLTIFCQVLIQC